VESLKEVLKNNPQAQVITNSGVGAKLKELEISFSLLEGPQSTTVKEVLIEAFEGKHEEIFEEIGQVQNTGYFVDNKLFYPGDSYIDPKKSVDVLALPVAGPWCRIKNSIEYAMRLKPRIAFPVHDGQLIKEKIGGFHGAPQNMLPKNGIEFVIMNEGDEKEF
jgi:L-ascorbate metabolism protein UlaG (beta-lactamase superfamily)